MKFTDYERLRMRGPWMLVKVNPILQRKDTTLILPDWLTVFSNELRTGQVMRLGDVAEVVGEGMIKEGTTVYFRNFVHIPTMQLLEAHPDGSGVCLLDANDIEAVRIE